MQRDADGDLFFGFCGVRVYVPDDDPHTDSIAERVRRLFRERLAAELAKQARTPVETPGAQER